MTDDPLYCNCQSPQIDNGRTCTHCGGCPDLTKGQIKELGKRRPFKTFRTFPINLIISEFVEVDPEVTAFIEEKLEGKKETYISPFTGKIT